MGFNFLRSIDSNYEGAVAEIAPDANILFIDPTVLEDKLRDFGADSEILNSPTKLSEFLDEITDAQSDELGVVFEQHLEELQPGATEALQNSTFENDNGELAQRILLTGPAVLNPTTIGETEYSFVIKPQEYINTKPDTIRAFLGEVNDLPAEDREELLEAAEGAVILFNAEEVEEIIDNMPGSNREWVRLIGHHEGQHIVSDEDRENAVGALSEEAEADRRALDEMRSEGDGDVALAWRDTRALSLAAADAIHATGPLLDSGDPASTLHIQGAENYQKTMLALVEDNYDFEGHEGEATSARELLREDPDAFFSTLNENVEATNAELVTAYNKDPTSYEATGLVVGAQIYTDYMNDFEDAYRRRVLDEDVPERNTSTQLIPQEAEDQYYVDLTRENEIDLIERSHRLQGRASGYAAFNDFDFEAYEGEATRVYELRDENPELYLEVIKDHAETIRAEAAETYEADPSHENLGALILTQYKSESLESEYNYEREFNVTGETLDVEPLELDPLVTDDTRRGYYEEEWSRQQEAKAAPSEDAAPAEHDHEHSHGHSHGEPDRIVEITPEIDYEQGPNETPYTTQVDGLQVGEPNVDFETGIDVNGASMPNVFAQSADPSPESISVVDPAQPEATTETAPIIPPQQTVTASAGARI